MGFTIQSNTLETKSAVKDLYNYLTDFNNFKLLLPEDKVEDFKSTVNDCSFNIRGITHLKISIKEKTPFNTIKYQSEGLAKMNFELEVSLTGENDKPGQCHLLLISDMNAFLRAFAEKPLTQLVNTMAKKLSELEVGPQP